MMTHHRRLWCPVHVEATGDKPVEVAFNSRLAVLPAMQSLIHGNFEGPSQKRVYALVGAAAAIAAAVGPLLGGFITTFLSWRIGFLLELVIIAVVLSGMGMVKDVPYTGPRRIDLV